MRIVLQFTKLGAMRYISHLDFQRLWQKMFRIAGIDLEMTKGFNPHPKMRFAVPLATGFESENELLEVYTASESIDVKALNDVAPHGLEIIAATPVPETFPKITSVVGALEYKVNFNQDVGTANSNEIVATKGGDVNLADFLLRLEETSKGLVLLVKVDNQKTLRPDDIIKQMYPNLAPHQFTVVRTGIYALPDSRISPLPVGLSLLND